MNALNLRLPIAQVTTGRRTTIDHPGVLVYGSGLRT